MSKNQQQGSAWDDPDPRERRASFGEVDDAPNVPFASSVNDSPLEPANDDRDAVAPNDPNRPWWDNGLPQPYRARPEGAVGVTFTAGYANERPDAERSGRLLEQSLAERGTHVPVTTNFDRPDTSSGPLSMLARDTKTIVENWLRRTTPESEHVKLGVLDAVHRGGTEVNVAHSKGTSTVNQGYRGALSELTNELVGEELASPQAEASGEETEQAFRFDPDQWPLAAMYGDLGRQQAAHGLAEDRAQHLINEHAPRVNCGGSSWTPSAQNAISITNRGGGGTFPDPVANVLADQWSHGAVEQRNVPWSDRPHDSKPSPVGHAFDSVYLPEVTEAVSELLPAPAPTQTPRDEPASTGSWWNPLSWLGDSTTSGPSPDSVRADPEWMRSSSSSSDEAERPSAPSEPAPAPSPSETSTPRDNDSSGSDELVQRLWDAWQ